MAFFIIMGSFRLLLTVFHFFSKAVHNHDLFIIDSRPYRPLQFIRFRLWCAHHPAILDQRVLTDTVAPKLFDRAYPNAPDGYKPTAGDCPSDRPTIRSASRLSPNETSWLQVRRSKTVDPMRDFLGRLDFGSLKGDSYISDHAQNVSALPNIAIAVSGGGYRALMNGGEG